MKTFYSADIADLSLAVEPDLGTTPGAGLSRAPGGDAAYSARLAIYDGARTPPRVEDVIGRDGRVFVSDLGSLCYSLARDLGGSIPYLVVREIIENLAHASFREAVVVIADGGNTIRVSDQGPGIPDKERVFEPGFSTATASMKSLMRGVGSGLPLVRECLGFEGGSVTIEDNVASGAVVTLRLPAERPEGLELAPIADPPPEERGGPTDALTLRQKKVLSLVMEVGSVGPTLVARELAVGLSTAYRDLALLETAGLLAADGDGQRVLTHRGIEYLDALFRP